MEIVRSIIKQKLQTFWEKEANGLYDFPSFFRCVSLAIQMLKQNETRGKGGEVQIIEEEIGLLNNVWFNYNWICLLQSIENTPSEILDKKGWIKQVRQEYFRLRQDLFQFLKEKIDHYSFYINQTFILSEEEKKVVSGIKWYGYGLAFSDALDV